MGFVVESSEGGSVPQEALRSIVEAVDTWRGQEAAFVVYRDKPPHEIASVHPTEAAARAAVKAEKGLNYFGPVAPRPIAGPVTVLKTTGCGLMALAQTVATIVLLDADENEVAQFRVNRDGPPNAESDIEAIFLTGSGIDKFMVPYLTRVFGADYAAARRREWIK